MHNFKFGVSSICFRHEKLETAIKILSTTGFDNIDLVFIPPDFCPHYNPLIASEEENFKLKTLIEKNSFVVSSLNISPGKLNKGNIDKTKSFIIKSIELCKLLGVKILTIPSGAKVTNFEWLENVKVVKKHLDELYNIAVDKDVILSVEAPHLNSLTESIEEVIRFFDIVNIPNLRCTFDTSHARLGEKYDITEAFKKIGPEKINHIHLRDTIKNSVNLTPGTGTCDYNVFLKYLEEIKYSGYLIYELEFHGYSNNKILSEISFANQFIQKIVKSEDLNLNFILKTNKHFNVIKRFLEHPKAEIKRHPKLFDIIRFIAQPLLKFRPDKLYEGSYIKRMRPFKGKVTHLKKNSMSLKTTKIIKVGIVGLGTVGMRWHAVGFNRLKEVRLVGGYDLDPAKNIQFSKKFGTKVFENIDDFFERSGLDLVIVTTREWQHYDIILKAFKNNVDVFCEKIISSKYSEAEKVVKLAKMNNRVLGVNYNYHYMPGILRIKEFIDNGDLGYLSNMNIIVSSACYAHSIDLVRFFGKKITSVSAEIRIDDNLISGHMEWDQFDKDIQYLTSRATCATFSFEDGSIITIFSSDIYDINQIVISIEAVFEKDILVLNGINMFNCVGKLTNSCSKKINYDLNINRNVYTKKFGYTFFESIKDFMQKYVNDEKPPTSGVDALFNLRLEKLIYLSSKNNQKVFL